jgi:hypothetical protein
LAFAEVIMEQPPAVSSGVTTLVFGEPVFPSGEMVEQSPAESISTTVELEVETPRMAALAMLDPRFARHDSASQPPVRINSFRVAEPVHDNLLLLMANDRVGRPSRQEFSAASDRNVNDHCDDELDSQSLADEPLAVALAGWR